MMMSDAEIALLIPLVEAIVNAGILLNFEQLLIFWL